MTPPEHRHQNHSRPTVSSPVERPPQRSRPRGDGVAGETSSSSPTRRRRSVALTSLAALVGVIAVGGILTGHRLISGDAGIGGEGGLREGLRVFLASSGMDDDDDAGDINDFEGKRSPASPVRRNNRGKISIAGKVVRDRKKRHPPSGFGFDKAAQNTADVGNTQETEAMLVNSNKKRISQQRRRDTLTRTADGADPHRPNDESRTKGTRGRQRGSAAINNGGREIPKSNTGENIPIYDGATATEVLHKQKSIPSNANGNDGGDHDRRHRLKFRPGTLQMTSAEALQHCHIDDTVYGYHFDPPSKNPNSKSKKVVLVSVSEEHSLIYRTLPKSASSTARWAMENVFNGADRRATIQELTSLVEDDKYTFLSFVRDPLSRFYSSYEEAYFRMGPWMGSGRIVANKPRVRTMYLNNKYRVEPYPYLYKGIETIDHYRAKYCAIHRKGTCDDGETIDKGDLSSRFENFVRDYDGRRPFDVHLRLQTVFLVQKSGHEPLPIQELYNASDAKAGWEEVARLKNVTMPPNATMHGRRIPRRFNMKLISDETKRRICRLAALDYCCLNLPLPPICAEEDAAGVFCAVERNDDDHVVIQPWSELEYFPDKDVNR